MTPTRSARSARGPNPDTRGLPEVVLRGGGDQGPVKVEGAHREVVSSTPELVAVFRHAMATRRGGIRLPREHERRSHLIVLVDVDGPAFGVADDGVGGRIAFSSLENECKSSREAIGESKLDDPSDVTGVDSPRPLRAAQSMHAIPRGAPGSRSMSMLPVLVGQRGSAARDEAGPHASVLFAPSNRMHGRITFIDLAW